MTGQKGTSVVMPSERFPNLLVNGAAGIAVGMATNIPSHTSWGEIIDRYLLSVSSGHYNSGHLEVIQGPDARPWVKSWDAAVSGKHTDQAEGSITIPRQKLRSNKKHLRVKKELSFTGYLTK